MIQTPTHCSALRYFGRYPAMGSARYRWGAIRQHISITMSGNSGSDSAVLFKML